jgi:hypothetical protein
MKTATNKRYSDLGVTAIWIDVHHAGEIWSTCHTHFMIGLRMALDHTYLTWSTYSNLLWSHQQRWTDALLSRKTAPESTSQLGWVARRTHLSFSPNTSIEVVHLSQASIDGRLLGLLDSYYLHAISTFNTCSRGPTHRSLTNIDEGYNLKGTDLLYHTPQPFQPTVLPFSPKGPAQSQVINLTITSWTRDEINPKSCEWKPPLDFYRKLSSKHSMC